MINQIHIGKVNHNDEYELKSHNYKQSAND